MVVVGYHLRIYRQKLINPKHGDGIGIMRKTAGGIISNTDNMTIMQSKTPGCRAMKDTSGI